MSLAEPRPVAPPTAAWHSLSPTEAGAVLATDPATGLSAAEAAERLEAWGPNELEGEAKRTWRDMLADQLRDPVVWVLLGAVVVSTLSGEAVDAVVIAIIVVLNAVLGVVQETKAERSLAALRRMGAPLAHVRRDGKELELAARCVVPGDVVLLTAGVLVPADVRLLETASLRVDESVLTGESQPVDKSTEVVLDPEAGLGDRSNLAFSGTAVTGGRGLGLAVATGSRTEVGRIGGMLVGMAKERTPLQERLEELGKSLAILVLAVCAVVFVVGLLRGVPALGMFLTSVSLAVAAVPEGLPAVVTIVLALGMSRLVRRHVIIRRLRAVETLGSTTTICTDKTGTLTQNEMTVTRFHSPERHGDVTGTGYAPEGKVLVDGEEVNAQDKADPGITALFRAAALCNDARLSRGNQGWSVIGDPTEGALLVAACKLGLSLDDLMRGLPREAEIPFDATRKRMTTVHANDGTRILFTKGAPDSILPCCDRIPNGNEVRPLTDADRARIRTENETLASGALRVLAVACGPLQPGAEPVEQSLTYLGLIGMLDPPRPEARAALQACAEAGIRVVMITGDYPLTARAVAEQLGLIVTEEQVLTGPQLARLSPEELRGRVREIAVFARVSPHDKLQIVTALQACGETVAMTGDGVNDAPALKKAEIGVAMGRRGTDVAKGAADMILTDDNFASIVAAVQEGRRIFDNIRRFIVYLLSCNLSEVLLLLIALLIGLPQPLLPVQLLWINLVTDGLPALALGLEPEEPGLMRRPPRPAREDILNRETLLRALSYGLIITAAAFTVFVYGLATEVMRAMGVSPLQALDAVFRPATWTAPELAPGLERARTLAFGALAFAQLAHALNCRSERESLFRLGLASNPHMVGAVVLSVVAQLVVIHVPWLASVFHTAPPDVRGILFGTALALLPLLAGELWKLFLRRRGHYRSL